MSYRSWLLLALLVPALASAAGKSSLPKCAVFDIKGLQGVSPDTTAVVNEIVATEVSKLKRFEVVSQADIANLLGLEKQRRLMGCSEDNACLAQIGGSLGVEYLLTGQVAKFGTRYRVGLVLQDVKKSKVIAREGAFCESSEDALAGLLQQLVVAIFKSVPAPSAPAPEQVASAPKPADPPKLPEAPKAPEPPKNPPAPVEVPAVASEGEVAAAASNGGSLGGKLALGGGAALLVGGGVLDYLAWRDYQAQKATTTSADWSSKRDASLFKGRVADGLYGAGAIAAGIGIWLLASGDSSAELSALPLPGGGVVQVSGVFR